MFLSTGWSCSEASFFPRYTIWYNCKGLPGTEENVQIVDKLIFLLFGRRVQKRSSSKWLENFVNLSRDVLATSFSLLVTYFVPQKCRNPFRELCHEILSLSETNYVSNYVNSAFVAKRKKKKKEKNPLLNETNSNIFIEMPFSLTKYSDYW